MRIQFLSFIFAVSALFMVGCTTSSGPVSVGQGVFMIARTHKSFGGSSAPVKAAALEEANKFCESQGKVMVVVKTVQKDMKPFQSDPYAEVYFMCVATNDPVLKSPPKIEEIRE
jgi:hypothetical protein